MSQIQPGSRVRVPKGTTIFTTNPQRRPSYRAGTTYTATINHVYEHGNRALIGEVMPDGHYVLQGHRRELERYCRQYGISTRGHRDEEAYKKLAELDNVVRTPCPLNEKIEMVWLELRAPSAVWAGKGGYWCEAALSDLELLESL